MRLPLTFPVGVVNKGRCFFVLQKDTEDLIVPFSGSHVQNGVAPAVQKAQVSPNPQQILHHIFLLGDYGQVQRCLGRRGQESQWLVGNNCSAWLQSHHCSMESYLGPFVTPRVTLNSVRSFLSHMVCTLKGLMHKPACNSQDYRINLKCFCHSPTVDILTHLNKF